MKFKLLLCLFLISLRLFAQENPKAPCDCDVLQTEQLGYVSEKQANQMLQDYIKRLAPLSRIRITDDKFLIRVALCPTPVSQICITTLPNGIIESTRLILYSHYFLERLNAQKKETTLVDKQVLLHELGHHVLGHHKNAKSIEALRVPYERTSPDPKRWNKYGSANPMAQELEADIYAVWALSKLENGFSVNDLIKGFNTETLKALDVQSPTKKQGSKQEVADGEIVGKYLSHPLFKDRIATMKKFESELTMSMKPVPRRYFSDIASTAYLDLFPESYVYDVSINAGISLAGKTDFSVGGEKTEGFLYPLQDFTNYHFGFTIDRFRWDRPFQTGLDVMYSQHQYGTTISNNEGSRLTEKLKVKYLTFSPKITWNSIGINKQQSLHSLRVGFLAGIGINARIPLGKPGYVNYVSDATAPEMLFSVGPKVTLGAAIMRKSFLPRGFKVLFSYDPQWIRLKTNGSPTAWSHNLECTLQYSIARF